MMFGLIRKSKARQMLENEWHAHQGKDRLIRHLSESNRCLREENARLRAAVATQERMAEPLEGK